MEPANNPAVSVALSKKPDVPVTPKEPVAPVVPAVPAVEPVVPAVPAVEPVVPAVEPVAPVEPVVPAVEPVAPVEPVVEPVVEPAETPDSAFFTSAKDILNKAGLPTAEIVSAIEKNNGIVPDATKAQIAEKIGQAEADVLLSGYEVEYGKAQTAQSDADKLVYDAVGGKDEWDKMAAWTGTPEAGLAPEAAQAYNDMLAQGGVPAQLAAKAIKEAYMESPGFKAAAAVAPVKLEGDATPVVNPVVETISRSKYNEEKKKAMRENDGVAVDALEKRARYTIDKAPDLWRGVRLFR